MLYTVYARAPGSNVYERVAQASCELAKDAPLQVCTPHHGDTFIATWDCGGPKAAFVTFEMTGRLGA